MSDALTFPGASRLGSVRSVPALFLDCVDRTPDRVAFTVPLAPPGHAFAELDRPGAPGAPEGWRQVTLRDALDNVAGLVVRLRSLGIGKGSPVAIVAETSHAWAALDLAILSLGGVTVGIYPTLPGKDIAWQLAHSKAQIVVVEDDALATRLAPFLDPLPELRHTFAMKEDAAIPALAPARPDLDLLRRQIAAISPDDPATVVYTSGTTGLPKGVLLRHRHFLANIAATALVEPIAPGSRSIVFLPLAHSLQRFAVYRGLVEELSGWFSPSIADLPQVIRLCRPQILVTVPRMLEKIKAKAEAQAAQRGPVPVALLRWAVLVGSAVYWLERGKQRVPLRLRLQQALAERLVGSRVRAALGGELTHIISGGAALSVEVGLWFEAMGMAVCEGWGLTETCAPATMTTVNDRCLGTVGRPLPGVELRLAEDGEVFVRGPGVFDGYLDQAQATAQVLTPAEDGGLPWFHTGDLGTIDTDGRLRITGRKKAIIVTAGGENIAPAPIEKAIEGGIIDQVIVVGDERPYLVALITLNLDVQADAQADAQAAVQAAVQARVDAANASLPSFATIKRWALLPRALLVEEGELTATLKIKRRVVVERYGDV
ncbi:MAG: long-chain fatty acid--CoA ligase, partial [Oligoflexia bacterium]|nr:long-chain fatty acid--CoA ligase [Oligoflexia bacterium]